MDENKSITMLVALLVWPIIIFFISLFNPDESPELFLAGYMISAALVGAAALMWIRNAGK